MRTPPAIGDVWDHDGLLLAWAGNCWITASDSQSHDDVEALRRADAARDRQAEGMTEKEAVDILLGKSLKERFLPRIAEALENERRVILSRGGMNLEMPMGVLAMGVLAITVLIPDEEIEDGPRSVEIKYDMRPAMGKVKR